VALKQPAPPNFDRLAAIYRWLEWAAFGPFLGRCRTAFLGELADCRQALVLGDGDGRFTARLLAAHPDLQVDAVDASSAMLRALRHRAGPHADRLRTYRADVRTWLPQGISYDLVITHFFLDCLSTAEVEALAAEVRLRTPTRARWLVSEFAIPAAWPWRSLARAIVAALYAAFGWLTGLRVRQLPDHTAALARAGFVLEKRRTWLGGLLTSEMWRAASDA
jgi:SAM-dependent methyltransferase